MQFSNLDYIMVNTTALKLHWDSPIIDDHPLYNAHYHNTLCITFNLNESQDTLNVHTVRPIPPESNSHPTPTPTTMESAALAGPTLC